MNGNKYLVSSSAVLEPCCFADLACVSDVSSNDFLTRYVVYSDYRVLLPF